MLLMPYYYFNSIKVQLEQIMIALLMSLPYFNSIKVQLEHNQQELSHVDQQHFNSIKVQLELPSGLILMRLLKYFNSIKVQLERMNIRLRCAFSKFQFHKGTIRTKVSWSFWSRTSLFQFHKGTIRTRLFYFCITSSSVISIP